MGRLPHFTEHISVTVYYCHYRTPHRKCLFCICSLTDKAVKDYSVYKPHLMFFGLANCIPHMLFSVSLTLAGLCGKTAGKVCK